MALKVLKEVFGYDSFRPPQGEAIQSVLNRRDTLVIMPTGAGKSICYQVPSLIFKGLTVVISPLIALMKDQVDQLKSLGVEACMLNSSLDPVEYRNNLEMVLSGRIRLLYLAPETALKSQIISALSEIKVDCLAIDEAHCISEWGHDFRPEYRQLTSLRKVFSSAVCVALTATATPRVREDIKRSLSFKESGDFIASFNRDNLFYQVVPKTDPYAQALTFLEDFREESGIIYCFSRNQVDTLCAFLNKNGYAARPYHAGLADDERRENQDLFRRDDVKIIVATIAFGLGINKTNIRFVLHFDLPKSVESYYQETGRAGRDGLPARCLLLYSMSDMYKIKYFIDQIDDEQRKYIANSQISSLVDFADAGECRRIPLLAHFGEEYTGGNCSMCDNCTSPPKEEVDFTVAAQKFLSCVRRTGELFGIGHIVDVLRGSESKKILERGHQNLSTYNIGGEFSRKEWMVLAGQFIRKGLLVKDMDAFGGLKITGKGNEVMRGEESFTAVPVREYGAAKASAAVRDYDPELFALLRKRRKEIADAERVPPYIVFSDKTLAEMATFYPGSRESFLSINGVGLGKWERYGYEFLSVIREYCEAHGISEVFKSPPLKAKKNGEYRHITVGRAFNDGREIGELMNEYGVKRATIISHLQKFYSEEGVLRKEGLATVLTLPDDVRDRIHSVFNEIGCEFIGPVFEKLEGTVSYDDLSVYRLAYMLEKQEQAVKL